MGIRRKREQIDTIYGCFHKEAKPRLDLTFDYEAAEIRAFFRIAESISPTLMLDIGANIGVYSIYLSQVKSISRIFAFEPAPAAFHLLEQNVKLQHRHRIICRDVALSEKEGVSRFAIFGDLAGNNAIEETRISGKAEAADSVEVATARIDDEVEATGVTFVCKIDVEGHELNVLSGGSEFLAGNTGVLQIEHFGDVEELDAVLERQGYSRIFRMKHDYYYTNIAESETRATIVDILFDEVARALVDLKDERRLRRRALRATRRAFDALRFGTDPVIGEKALKSRKKR